MCILDVFSTSLKVDMFWKQSSPKSKLTSVWKTLFRPVVSRLKQQGATLSHLSFYMLRCIQQYSELSDMFLNMFDSAVWAVRLKYFVCREALLSSCRSCPSSSWWLCRPSVRSWSTAPPTASASGREWDDLFCPARMLNNSCCSAKFQ